MASDFENLDDLDWADVEGELEANRDAIRAPNSGMPLTRVFQTNVICRSTSVVKSWRTRAALRAKPRLAN